MIFIIFDSFHAFTSLIHFAFMPTPPGFRLFLRRLYAFAEYFELSFFFIDTTLISPSARLFAWLTPAATASPSLPAFFYVQLSASFQRLPTYSMPAVRQFFRADVFVPMLCF